MHTQNMLGQINVLYLYNMVFHIYFGWTKVYLLTILLCVQRKYFGATYKYDSSTLVVY